MEIVTAVAGKVVDLTVVPIGRQLGYLIFYRTDVNKLKTSVEKLKAKIDDTNISVEAAKQNGETTPFPSVQKWIEDAEETVADATALIQKEAQGEGSCLKWPFPNLCKRYSLSREAKKLERDVSNAMLEGKFEKLCYRSRPEMSLPPSSRDYEAMWSRTSTLDEVKQALKNPGMCMVGVYGMGGVGKTTLAKELAWQTEKECLFGVVVMAVITSTPNLRGIQGQLADGLGLKFDSETEEGRAVELRRRIHGEKSILVILDDIWGELDLTKVGVPYGDQHKGCKLVLTGRDLNVLHRMGTQTDFPLGVLSEEESWSLFETMVGDVVRHDSIKPIAVEVAKCCFGLPLLIVTVAKALRKKEDEKYWKDSLKKLRKFDPQRFHKSVYDSLEFSYDCLENEELKSLFMLNGSLVDCFSKSDGSFNTQKLLPFCWGLGLYKDVHTLLEGRNRHHALVNDLIASSLLLDSGTEGVRMHDLVRDVAKLIASRTFPTFDEQEFRNINKWPNKDQLQKYHHIILPHCRISKFPDEKLEYPNLKLFFLQSVVGKLNVPDNFFSGMRGVKVLHFDIGYYAFHPLPSSLRLLANLRSLKLSGHFEGLAMIGELTSLEILELKDKAIKELPKEIGHLTQLRLLNVRRCERLRLIPKNLLSNLKSLEELYMWDCNMKWEAEGSNKSSNNASLYELKNLHKLATLELKVEHGSLLPNDLHNLANLEGFKIIIGSSRNNYMNSYPVWPRSLILKGASTAYILQNDVVKVLLSSAEYLDIYDLECLEDIFPGLHGDGFAELRSMSIRCTGLRCIINSNFNHFQLTFPKLEKLNLDTLNNMKEISHGPFPSHSFHALKSIVVSRCDVLNHIFLWSEIGHLSQLQNMEISECQSMQEIVAGGMLEMKNIVLPQLRSVSLKSLPRLVSFCSVPMTSDDMGFVPVALFDNKVAMPNIETMVLFEINIYKVWDDGLPMHHSFMKNLTSLTVEGCENLITLFPSSVATALQKLHHLKIMSCPSLEQIFDQEEDLENHRSSLEQVMLPNLKIIEVQDLLNLKSLWANHMSPNSLHKLCKMRIMNCPKLINVFPSSVIKRLINLETLLVTKCGELQVIFEIQEPSTVTTSQQQGLPTRLRTLDLSFLPKLKYIWSKDPHGILSFQNLCEVRVFDSQSLEHVFPVSMANETHQFKVLEIYCCGVENIFDKSEFGRLKDAHIEVLTLNSCDHLKNIFPSSVNFQNLDGLYVEWCKELVNIMTPSMAASLTSLRVLNISECDMIEEIIASDHNNNADVVDDGDALSEIAFMKLEKLELSNLRSLKCFCKGTYSFKFPSLHSVTVRYCPMMETFCDGNSKLCAPRLTEVISSRGIYEYDTPQRRWDGDLNTTIRNIFIHKAQARLVA
ncbi:hypothetical protein HN873_024202 [Arachis hypogaea]|nr:Disease resistance protein [Arachis hypogaea]QHO28823.1 Disease resistance protein [Arachis hypogaea]